MKFAIKKVQYGRCAADGWTYKYHVQMQSSLGNFSFGCGADSRKEAEEFFKTDECKQQMRNSLERRIDRAVGEIDEALENIKYRKRCIKHFEKALKLMETL